MGRGLLSVLLLAAYLFLILMGIGTRNGQQQAFDATHLWDRFIDLIMEYQRHLVAQHDDITNVAVSRILNMKGLRTDH